MSDFSNLGLVEIQYVEVSRELRRMKDVSFAVQQLGLAIQNLAGLIGYSCEINTAFIQNNIGQPIERLSTNMENQIAKYRALAEEIQADLALLDSYVDQLVAGGATKEYNNALKYAYYEYEPRLEAPTTDNDFYFSNKNRLFSIGNKYECTWYANGRVNEILSEAGSDKTFDIHGNAGEWYDNFPEYSKKGELSGVSGVDHVMEAKPGAVVVWTGGSKGYGHVAVVEEVRSDGIVISEANYPHSIENENGKIETIFYPYAQADTFTTFLSYDDVKERDALKFKGYIYTLDD